jgi:hypothetical protein
VIVTKHEYGAAKTAGEHAAAAYVFASLAGVTVHGAMPLAEEARCVVVALSIRSLCRWHPVMRKRHGSPRTLSEGGFQPPWAWVGLAGPPASATKADGLGFFGVA